jgi:hypothetical protein
MWIVILSLIIITLLLCCAFGVEKFTQTPGPSTKDLIVVHPHEIVNSNFKVFKDRAPTESQHYDNYLLARPLPTPTTRYMSPDDLIRDCVTRGHSCSMILENPRKEMWGYNQYTPILLEYRQGYNTYIGEQPKTIKVDLLKFDHEVPTDYIIYKDFAPQYAVLGTHGFTRSVASAKKWCQRDTQNIDTPCRNFVHNKKTGFIMTNQPGDILYSSPGYDTYVGK